MKIVLLDGGLANQLQQYVFARNLEIHTGETVWLDDSWFFVDRNDDANSLKEVEVHEYQLDKFKNAKPNLLSQYFTPEVWGQIIAESKTFPPVWSGSYMPQVLKHNGFDFFMVCDVKFE